MKKLIKFGFHCLVYLLLLALSPVIITIVFLMFLFPSKVFIYFLKIFVYIIIFLVFQVGNKIKIVGKENLPKGSRILFLSNHQTLIDSFLIVLGTMSFWDALFNQKRLAYNLPEIDNFYFNDFVRIFFKALKTIPISRNRTSRTKIEMQIDQFSRLLEKDNLIMFFEGTRTRTGEINDCKIGPALTIIKARPLYVIPILLEGIQPIMPINYGSKINLRINMGNSGQMVIGKPLNVKEFYQETYGWDDAIKKSEKLRKIIKESVENLKKASTK